MYLNLIQITLIIFKQFFKIIKPYFITSTDHLMYVKPIKMNFQSALSVFKAHLSQAPNVLWSWL